MDTNGQSLCKEEKKKKPYTRFWEIPDLKFGEMVVSDGVSV